MEQALEEMITFLNNNARPDLQILALDNILAITGTEDGLQLIIQKQDLISSLITLLESTNLTVKRTSILILVNISANMSGPTLLLDITVNFTKHIIRSIADPNCENADLYCMILSNITRPSVCAKKVLNSIENLNSIFDIVTKIKYNNKDNNLYYLGVVLSNLSQQQVVRDFILDHSKSTVQKLLPFTEFKDSIIKRGGIVGTLRNCCFEVKHHSWLLSNEVDILPRLLLPLTDNTEFSEEENDNLPLELQYLPKDKEREEDPDIRCMLLEALSQLCTLRVNRQFIRSQNTYIILRELHKWEKDRKALLACENLVDILIRTETEIGKDNIKETDIPEHLVPMFDKMDNDFLADN